MRQQDVAEGATFTTTFYGATRTYIATSNFRNGVGTTSGFTGWMRLGMRYD
jgi:hypothetical protein